MRSNLIRIAFAFVLFLSAALVASSQADKSKRPSPPGTAEVTLKGKRITIDYSRPSLRGRPMETLTPAGKVWRTGANEATALTTEADITIGDANAPAGKYTQ